MNEIRNVLKKELAYNRCAGCNNERPMYPCHEVLKFLAAGRKYLRQDTRFSVHKHVESADELT